MGLTVAPTGGNACVTEFTFTRDEFICPVDQELDAIFILDRSAGVTPTEFSDIKAFVMSVVSTFTISPVRTRIGIIYTGNGLGVATLQLSINSGTSLSLVNAGITSIPATPNGPSLFGSAMFRANQDFTSFGRIGVLKKVFIVSVSKSSSYTNPSTLIQALPEARDLRNIIGAEIYTIGIGNNIAQDELLDWTGNRQRHLLLADTTADLPDIEDSTRRALCPISQDYLWDLGDGTIITNESPITHVYDNPGIYEICFISCSSLFNLGGSTSYGLANVCCSTICVEPAFCDAIEFTNYPIKLNTGQTGGQLFQFCASSTCFPIKINLGVANSQSCSPHEVSQNSWQHLIPQWNFYDITGAILQNHYLSLNDVTVVSGYGGKPIGYIGCGCFYFKDDMPSTVTVFATIDISCQERCTDGTVLTNYQFTPTNRFSSNANIIQTGMSQTVIQTGINASGHLRSKTSIGIAGRSNMRQLQKIMPVVFNDFPLSDADDVGTFPISFKNPYNTNYLHFNPENLPRFLNIYGQEYFENKRNIGFWVWEVDKIRKNWKISSKFYDEIWTASTYCKEVFQEELPGMKVIVVPHVIELPNIKKKSKKKYGMSPDRFTFGYSFDCFSRIERKNPLMLIEAFKKAFPRNKNVELILKPSNFSEEFQKSIYEAIGNSTRIKILNKFLPESDFYQFMKSLDCFVSPHRSEGFGLHCAECMAIGTPVIATGYSGNMEFMNDKNSYLIDYKLVKSTDHYYGNDAHWAQPDMDSLVDLMKSSLVKDEKRIMEAKKDIDTICSPNSVRNIMNSLI